MLTSESVSCYVNHRILQGGLTLHIKLDQCQVLQARTLTLCGK